MAYQVGAVCYATSLQAAAASASSHLAGLSTLGGVPHSLSVGVQAGSSGPELVYSLTPVGGGTSTVHIVPYEPQPCGLADWSDGLSLGWMVAAVWFSVYSISFLARMIRGETGGTYGNT